MFSRIHSKLGTAGLVVAIVALVAALSGAAIAANGGLTGKQKKEVKNIAKQYAGKKGATGAAGPAGPAGAKGDTGAAGANGKDGAPGAKGEEGEEGPEGPPGPFPTVLESGKTLTGHWSTPPVFAGGSLVTINISYQFPLAANAEPVFLKKDNETAFYGEESDCTGTAAAPTAAPGTLCIYTAQENGIALAPTGEGISENSKYGYNTYVGMSSPGGFSGSWAVLAP